MIDYSNSLRKARRPALLAAVSATVLLLAGCDNSTSSEPSTSPTSEVSSTAETSAPPAPPKVRAQGRVNSVSGSTVALGAKSGPTAVAITSSTRVSQVSIAKLTDVATGSCVDVRKAAAAKGAPPATSAPAAPPAPATRITVSAAPSGKCAQSSGDTFVTGAVTSVSGNSISVENAPAAIPFDQQTTYFKKVDVSALAITQGACLTAVGTLDPGGVLKALSATIGLPAANGVCQGA